MKIDVGFRIKSARWTKGGVLVITPRDPEIKEYNKYVTYVLRPFKALWIRFYSWFYKLRLRLFPMYTEMDFIPEGWRKAFGENLCKDLKEASKGEPDFVVHQMKEKYGALRIYYSPCTPKIREVVDKYEKLSARTCVMCGKPASWISHGWIAPYCDDCKLPNNHHPI